MYRFSASTLQVLLVHPGGPYWRTKDGGSWSIPKGEMSDRDDPKTVARREFKEEIGTAITTPLTLVGEITQKGGKRVVAYMAEGQVDAKKIKSNTFEIEWPPRSRKYQTFPEVDRAGWFDTETARSKILASQIPFIDALETRLHPPGPPRASQPKPSFD